MGSGRKHKGQGISILKDEGRYIGKPGEPADSGKNIETLAKACQAALNRLIGTDSDGGNT